MIVAINGPSTSGKTTLGLELIHANKEFSLVSGDDFIGEFSGSLDKLRRVLASNDHIIFEHICASQILQTFEINYDASVLLTGSCLVKAPPNHDLLQALSNFHESGPWGTSRFEHSDYQVIKPKICETMKLF